MAGMKKADLAAALLDMLVGLPESEAAALVRGAGLTYRVTSRDGVRNIITTDYRQNRINFVLKGDKVERATVG